MFEIVSFGAEREWVLCKSIKTKAAQTIPQFPLTHYWIWPFPTVSFDVKWELCSSVETAAAAQMMIPPCDHDSLMIRFTSYKQTQHTFGLPFHSDSDSEVQEFWVFPDAPTEAIMVRRSDFYKRRYVSALKTPSGCMLRDYISTQFTSLVFERKHLEEKIIKVARKGIASGAKGFVDVRRRETINVSHELNDKETIRRMKKKFEESRRGTCTICFEDYEIQRDDGIRLPCGHGFHGHCISEWLVINPRCPVCSQTLKRPQILIPWFNPPAQDGLLMSISIPCDEPVRIEELGVLQSEVGIDRGTAKPRRLLKKLKSIFAASTKKLLKIESSYCIL